MALNSNKVIPVNKEYSASRDSLDLRVSSCFLNFQSRETNSLFEEFRRSDVSIRTLLIFQAMVTAAVLSLKMLYYSTNPSTLSTTSLGVGVILVVVSGWCLLIVLCLTRHSSKYTSSSSFRFWLPLLENVYILGHIACGALSLADVVMNTHSHGEMPEGIMGLMIMVPVVAMIVVKSVKSEIMCLSFVFNIAAIVFIMVHFERTKSVGVFVTFVLMGNVALYEYERQNLSTFLTSQKLQGVQNQKEQLEYELQNSALKHLIGNVAHDLKTPLSSLSMGIDQMSDAAAEIQSLALLDDQTRDALGSHVGCIQDNIANMRNVNVFMLMTINRCMDYTKATTGVKLVPKIETIDLAETIGLPLHVMGGAQARKHRVELIPIPENVCACIITDKQWLQENLLCLLSNAIKYSNGGLVTVSLRLRHRVAEAGTGTGKRNSDKNLRNDATREWAPSGSPPFPIASPNSQRTHCSASASASVSSYCKGGLKLANYVSSVASTLSSKDEPAGEKLSQNDNGGRSSAELGGAVSLYDIEEGGDNSGCTGAPCGDNSLRSIGNENIFLMGQHESPPIGESLRIDVPHPPDNQQGTPLSPASPGNTIFLRVEVEDMGIGLSADAMASLFSAFNQAQRLAGGTGLGLFSLSKRVEALGGRYGVRGRRDLKQGSIFWFEIPYRADEEFARTLAEGSINNSAARSRSRSISAEAMMRRNSIASSSPSSSLIKTALTPKSPQRMTTTLSSFSSMSNVPLPAVTTAGDAKRRPLNILLADDSVSIQKMTCMALRRLGHTVTVADNGAEALEMITTKYAQMTEQQRAEEEARTPSDPAAADATKVIPFDIVLMDFQMPIMDGLEATRRIRALEADLRAERRESRHSATPFELDCMSTTGNDHGNSGGAVAPGSRRTSTNSVSGGSESALMAKLSNLLSSSSPSPSQSQSHEPPFSPLKSSTGRGSASRGSSRPITPAGQMNEHGDSIVDTDPHHQQDGGPVPSSSLPLHQFIVGLSANSDEETLAVARRMGIDEFIEKPFKAARFEAIVQRYEELRGSVV